MLNYIWAGLIVFSLVFALVADGTDLARDTYRNGGELPVVLDVSGGFDAEAEKQPVTLRLDGPALDAFYGTADAAPDSAGYAATLRRSADGPMQLRLDDAEASLPAPLDVIRDVTNPRDKVLQGDRKSVV